MNNLNSSHLYTVCPRYECTIPGVSKNKYSEKSVFLAFLFLFICKVKVGFVNFTSYQKTKNTFSSNLIKLYKMLWMFVSQEQTKKEQTKII